MTEQMPCKLKKKKIVSSFNKTRCF